MRDEVNKIKQKRNECFILNIDHSRNNGTHWCCLFTENKKSCYFDPFGIQPPLEIESYCVDAREAIYSTFEIQKSNEVICGHYCIYVLYKLSNGEEFLDILDELYNYSHKI